jgi:hypothetical protein
MIDGELLPLTLIESNQSSIVRGVIVCADRISGLVDVKIGDVTYVDMPVHYNCQDGDKAQGYKAFKIDDVVLVKNKAPNDPIESANLIVVGFSDGYPRMCVRRLILFSVFDGNPSYYYSGQNHVLWDIDAAEIVMGPCSLIELQQAGFIETLYPLIIIKGYGIPATGFIQGNSEYLASYVADANISGLSIPGQDDLDSYIFKEDSGPDFDVSVSDTDGPTAVTNRSWYNAFSLTSVSSDEQEARTGGYTTTLVEDHWVGYDDPPYYFIGHYNFVKSGSGFNEKAQAELNLFYYDSQNPAPTVKESAGLFYTSHLQYDLQKQTTTGDTAWAVSGTMFGRFPQAERYRKVISENIACEDRIYYSPIGILHSFNLETTLNSTVEIIGVNDPVTLENDYTSMEPDVELGAYSMVSVPEQVKDDGHYFYEQIAVAVYVMTGVLRTYHNGVATSETPVAGVNASVDVYDMDDYDDYNAFDSSNIDELSDAIASAILNSDGGKEVATTFFRGSIS